MNNDDTFKTNNNNLTPELEARVVAWVLGEATPFEVAVLERACAEQPELALFKRRMEAVHGLVGEAAMPAKELLRLSPQRRAQVLEMIGGNAPVVESAVAATPEKARRQARSWRSWALPMAACFTMMLVLAAVIIPTVGKVQQKASRSVEASNRRQAEQLRLIEQQESVQQVVDNSVSASYAPKNKAEAKENREVSVNGYAVGSLRSSEAPGSHELFFDSAKVSSGLQSNEPLPAPPAAPASAMRAGSDAESPPAGVVNFGYAVVSDDLYAGPPVFAHDGNPQLPKLRGHLDSGISITAGTPQEFTSQSMIPAGSRKLSDSEKARFLKGADNDTPNLSNSVASDVRHRRDMSFADPFAAPDAGPVSGNTVLVDENQQAKLVAKGRSQYLAGDVSGAQETFQTLKAVAPENPNAGSFLERIQAEKNAVEDLNRVKTRAQMMEEVSSAWQRPSGYKKDATNTSGSKQDTDGVAMGAQASNPQADKLRQIVIPSVSFKGVPLSKVITTLMSVSAEYDRFNENGSGANIVLIDPSNNDPSVSVTLRNLTLGRILDLITSSTGYRYEIQGDAVVVRPEGQVSALTVADKPGFDKLRSETQTATEAISTFSLHVSDASFRLAKAALARGEAPDPTTIRPEEFYNAFDYGDPSPVAGEPVSCRIEQAAHPFLQQRNLVRVAMQVPATGRGAGTPLRLTVLLDTSGSMEREDRAATVRAAFTSLASLLGPNDRVTLIGFARTPRLLAESVAGDQARKLIDLAARTPAEGGTNMEEALALAGKLALRQKLAGAQNRIVLLTDGAANLGDADPQQLGKRVEALRQNGIAFDACGVVADGLDDTVLEALTRKGDGRYTILNSPEEADSAFARQLAGAFRPAAKDVKVQVRFNPARVARYRLIGFEQHRLKTEDFRNDAIDAAELAAEESAVAVYQVEVLPEGEGELGDVSVRFLDTRSNERVERTWTLAYTAQPTAFARATPSLQLAGSAAFLAEKLRGGALAGQIRLEEFAPVVEGLAGHYPQAARVQEFITMFRQARRLTGE